MAKTKLDTTQIPGFDALPPETQTALSAFELEIPDPDYSGYVKKDVFDRKASEAASLTKQLREKMTEAEQKEADDAKRWEDTQAELTALRREKAISDHTARLTALGYDGKLAATAATALADGDMEAFFAAQQKHQEAAEKKLRADLLMDTPKPAPGSGGGALTKKQFLAMPTQEQLAYIKDNPNWRSELK